MICKVTSLGMMSLMNMIFLIPPTNEEVIKEKYDCDMNMIIFMIQVMKMTHLILLFMVTLCL